MNRRKMGIKAEVKAPSPNKRRNKFGNVKPSKNAELQILAPSDAMINTSLSRPVIRDKIVVPLTDIISFNSLLTNYFIRVHEILLNTKR